MSFKYLIWCIQIRTFKKWEISVTLRMRHLEYNLHQDLNCHLSRLSFRLTFLKLFHKIHLILHYPHGILLHWISYFSNVSVICWIESICCIFIIFPFFAYINIWVFLKIWSGGLLNWKISWKFIIWSTKILDLFIWFCFLWNIIKLVYNMMLDNNKIIGGQADTYCCYILKMTHFSLWMLDVLKNKLS